MIRKIVPTLIVSASLLLGPQICCAQSDGNNETTLDPYWARETRLHADALSGNVEGSPAYGFEYNVQVPPKEDDKQATVSVQLNVFKIKEINIATSQLKLSVWLRMSWKDPRLAWNASNPLVGVN